MWVNPKAKAGASKLLAAAAEEAQEARQAVHEALISCWRAGEEPGEREAMLSARAEEAERLLEVARGRDRVVREAFWRESERERWAVWRLKAASRAAAVADRVVAPAMVVAPVVISAVPVPGPSGGPSRLGRAPSRFPVAPEVGEPWYLPSEEPGGVAPAD